MGAGDIFVKGKATASTTPSAGYGVVKFDSVLKKWKSKDDSAAQKTFQFEEDAAATAVIHNWKLLHTVSPLEELINKINLLNFNDQGDQKVFSELVEIPASYTEGDPITLEDLLFFAEGTSNNVLFRCKTYLIQPGTNLIDPSDPNNVPSGWNSHISTNTENTLAGSAHELYSIGSIDLSDGSGGINSVAVAPGDLLLIELYRDVGNESVSSSGAVRLVHNKQNLTLG